MQGTISRRGSRHRSIDVSLPPFQHLLDHHQRDVYRLCAALVGPDEADDCFQETYLAALRAYPGLRSATNLRSWLLTIAHHKALDALRARRRHALGANRFEDAGPPDREPPDGTLWRAVRALPTKQREAVALRFAGDLAYAEVGAAIGCSEEAARRSVHEGLTKLREGWSR